MINENVYGSFEKNIISKVNRFKLTKKDLLELRKSFNNKIILITGAAGSIGSQFSKDILKKNLQIKKIIFLDKDENMLTELNRELILFKNFKKINKEFICSDLNLINIDEIICANKVQFYLNFAAIKHVRSEENIQSIKYMFQTNSINFLPKRLFGLKKIFSISTDKSVNPSSILGVSKHLMEINLGKFKNKNIFVSSSRFANVSFSNGSILKYIFDRISQRKEFGIPKNIRRFFITHAEASSLCFKSLLKRNNKKIVIPNLKSLDKDFLITELAEKIVRKKNLIPKFCENKIIKKNYKNKICQILLTRTSDGQKKTENFFSHEENIFFDKDKSICKIKLPSYSKKFRSILDKILKIEKINKLKKYLSKEFKNYNPPKNYIKISDTI